MPTPPATTSSISSNALGACASPQWPYTISARSLVSIAPRGPRRRLPRRVRIALPPSRGRSRPCRRLPLFLDADPVRGGVPPDAIRLGLVEHSPGMFRGRLRLLAAGLVDQHLLPGGRRGTRPPSGRDGRPRLCPTGRRPPLSIPVHGRCLASAPALVRGRCLLPPYLSMALAAPRGRHGELRRAHHPALDAEISHQQGLHHHPQQVHALRETILG